MSFDRIEEALRAFEAGVGASRPTTQFEYGGCCVEVTGPPEVVSAVQADLSPFVVVGGGAEPNARVEVTLGIVPDGLTQDLRRFGEEIPIDASLYRSRTNGSRAGLRETTAILIQSTGTVCWHRTPDTRVRLWAPSPDSARQDLLRTMKTLLVSWAEITGGLAVHSSAVLVGDRAVMLAGDSRNGKTSLLLELLMRTESSMVSCDTVVVRRENERVRVTGWPSNFSLSVGTAHDYPALVPLLAEPFRDLTYAEAWAIYPKEVLDAAQVVEQLGVPLCTSAELGAAVFARFDPGSRTELVPLDEPERVRRWLDTVCLGSLDPLYPNWLRLWSVSDKQLETRKDEMARLMVETVPMYELTWAPGPLQLLRHLDLIDVAFRRRTSGDVFVHPS